MRHKGFRSVCSYRCAPILAGATVLSTTLAMYVVGAPAGFAATPAAGTPICEQVSVSGDLTGSLGPFGDCLPNPANLPVNCVTAAPSVGTLITVSVEVCVVD